MRFIYNSDGGARNLLGVKIRVVVPVLSKMIAAAVITSSVHSSRTSRM